MSVSNRIACLVAAVSLVGSSSVAAQFAAGTRPVESTATIAVDFPGGNLGQYLALLREAGGDVNIALASAAAVDVALPPIHLGAVTGASAVRLLEDTYEIDPNNSVRIDVDEIEPEEGASTPPIFRISAERTTVTVWNVLDLFGDAVSASDVLTAIESAVKLVSDRSRDPQILFHESTGVLIVRGTPRQVETIGRVLDELRGHLVLKGMYEGWEQFVADSGGPALVADLQAQVAELANRLSALEARCRAERK